MKRQRHVLTLAKARLLTSPARSLLWDLALTWIAACCWFLSTMAWTEGLFGEAPVPTSESPRSAAGRITPSLRQWETTRRKVIARISSD